MRDASITVLPSPISSARMPPLMRGNAGAVGRSAMSVPVTLLAYSRCPSAVSYAAHSGDSTPAALRSSGRSCASMRMP